MNANRHPQKGAGVINMFVLTMGIGILLAIGISYLRVSNEGTNTIGICQIAGIRG